MAEKTNGGGERHAQRLDMLAALGGTAFRLDRDSVPILFARTSASFTLTRGTPAVQEDGLPV
jgi:hypothetical protein